MSAPIATGTTNNGKALFATLQAIQASGANSNGVVSNLAVSLSDVSITTVAVKTSTTGIQYAEFDPLKVGTSIATVTLTVTDPDGTEQNFTVTANVVVIPGANDTLTASVEVLFSSTVPA